MYKQIITKRHPKYGWGMGYNWQCRMCGRVYVKQQDARFCCAVKKKVYIYIKSLLDKIVDCCFKVR